MREIRFYREVPPLGSAMTERLFDDLVECGALAVVP
jgi:hypothetical protein